MLPGFGAQGDQALRILKKEETKAEVKVDQLVEMMVLTEKN